MNGRKDRIPEEIGKWLGTTSKTGAIEREVHNLLMKGGWWRKQLALGQL